MLLLFCCRENDVDECDVGLCFSAEFEVLGQIQTKDLKPGGADIHVTQENKEEYLMLMTNWFFSRGVEKQTESFLDGFNEVVPLQWLQYFDEKELEVCSFLSADFFLLVYFDD